MRAARGTKTCLHFASSRGGEIWIRCGGRKLFAYTRLYDFKLSSIVQCIFLSKDLEVYIPPARARARLIVAARVPKKGGPERLRRQCVGEPFNRGSDSRATQPIDWKNLPFTTRAAPARGVG